MATNQWQVEKLTVVFLPLEMVEIQKLSRHTVSCHDKLLWTADKRGKFSVKICHNLIASHQTSLRDTSLWKAI